MKDWKTILLEQIIRENLSEQITVTVVTKSIAIGSDATLTQFNASDKAWIAALPEKGKNEKYNRVYVKIKSNVTGTTTPGSVPATERIKKIKDFLDDNTVKTALTKVDKDWIWIISNPETSRFKSAGSPDDPDNPGAQVFMIAGMRKADINNFDTGLNNITPAHGKLANGNPVYSEAQIADLKILSSKQKPTAEPDTNNILQTSAIAGKLTDIRELQKYLYAYFNKNKSNLPEDVKTFLNEFIQENYNSSTGEWSGDLNYNTKKLANIFALVNPKLKFNYPAGENMFVLIDSLFRANLAKKYAPLQVQERVIQHNILLIEQDEDWSRAIALDAKEDENGNLKVITPPEEKKKVTPVVQGGDGKKKPEEKKPEEQKLVDDSKLLTVAQVKEILNGSKMPFKDKYKKTIYITPDKKWYCKPFNASDKTSSLKYPGPWETTLGNIVKDLGGGRCTWGVHFISKHDVKEQFVLFYTVGIKGSSESKQNGKYVGLSGYGQCIRYNVTVNPKQIASNNLNYFLHPNWFAAKLDSKFTVESAMSGYFTNPHLGVNAIGAEDFNPATKLDSNALLYSELTLPQKIVGRLYYSNDDDHLEATIKMIRTEKVLKQVIDLMNLIAKQTSSGDRFLIPYMKTEKFMTSRVGKQFGNNGWGTALEIAGYGSMSHPFGKQGWEAYDYDNNDYYFAAAIKSGEIYNSRSINVAGRSFTQNPLCYLIEDAMGGSERQNVYDYFYTNADKLGIDIGGYPNYLEGNDPSIGFILPKEE